MNRGAIAEPYVATGKTVWVVIDVGAAMNSAIFSGLRFIEPASDWSALDEEIA